jgi:hypothetical protein
VHFRKVLKGSKVVSRKEKRMTPEELKAQLMAEAEAIISEMVGQEAKTLSEMEQAVVSAGGRFKEAMIKGLVGSSELQHVDRACPSCGGKLSAKGKRRKWVLTQVGEVQVERDYYYCAQCKTGFFPQ